MGKRNPRWHVGLQSARRVGSRSLGRRGSTSMQNEPNIAQTPFKIEVAERVKRLPPYLFGKINELKYRKRRAGVDVIDLGMGNPTDIPDPQVIEKLCEAAR